MPRSLSSFRSPCLCFFVYGKTSRRMLQGCPRHKGCEAADEWRRRPGGSDDRPAMREESLGRAQQRGGDAVMGIYVVASFWLVLRSERRLPRPPRRPEAGPRRSAAAGLGPRHSQAGPLPRFSPRPGSPCTLPLSQCRPSGAHTPTRHPPRRAGRPARHTPPPGSE